MLLFKHHLHRNHKFHKMKTKEFADRASYDMLNNPFPNEINSQMLNAVVQGRVSQASTISSLTNSTPSTERGQSNNETIGGGATRMSERQILRLQHHLITNNESITDDKEKKRKRKKRGYCDIWKKTKTMKSRKER
mmetsp:Transcript_3152/g.4619  ORF Transcript_3152/g.4619 Transcript_3152/m.4619 type:complete len:136 (-) Transcript_3152:105-512(-)